MCSTSFVTRKFMSTTAILGKARYVASKLLTNFPSLVQILTSFAGNEPTKLPWLLGGCRRRRCYCRCRRRAADEVVVVVEVAVGGALTVSPFAPALAAASPSLLPVFMLLLLVALLLLPPLLFLPWLLRPPLLPAVITVLTDEGGGCCSLF